MKDCDSSNMGGLLYCNLVICYDWKKFTFTFRAESGKHVSIAFYHYEILSQTRMVVVEQEYVLYL